MNTDEKQFFRNCAATAKQIFISLVLLLMAQLLFATSAAVMPGEMAKVSAWVEAYLVKDGAQPPFAFNYDNQPFSQSFTTWTAKRAERKLDDSRTEHTVTYTDPKTGLVVRCVAVVYRDFPTVEWTLYFKNTGATNTPLLTDIQAIATSFQRPVHNAAADQPKIRQGFRIGRIKPEKYEFVLHHQTGSPALATDYEPFETLLPPKAEKRIVSATGRPTNSDLPYFNIAAGGEGCIVVIGWSGKWAVQFTRDENRGLRVRGGQELTRFKLHAGEEVRSPMVVLQFWEGDWIRGQNIWRRWMVAHNLPRPGGKLPAPLAGTCIDGQFPGMRSNADAQMAAMDTFVREKMFMTHWWIDAGWYPCTNWPQVGTWEVDRARYPKGLRGVFDYARERGMQSVLWFEPERAMPGTELYREHPDWLLGLEGKTKLVNLGNEAARRWIADRIDKVITEEHVSLYRQDFNIDPLRFWHANDTEDRQGITEIYHVTGYLALWDELRRRHPDMLIDSCAGGGGRNDLETLRRAVPLLQSDYRFEPVSQQCHNYGISFWMPYHGTGTDQTEADAYVFRSHMCSGLGYGWEMKNTNVNYAEIRRLVNQWRKIVDNYLGDYYPLTRYTQQNDEWLAWQFDRPEIGEGVVQAFRRDACPYETARFKLRGLDPDARYVVTNLDAKGAKNISGRELMEKGLLVTLGHQPDSAVITYKKKSD